jgi:ADP-heptose:LPS heptosyltransferase
VRVAVVTGDGLGNVIMATPAARAVAALGHDVGFLLKDNAKAWLPAFEDWDEVETCGLVEERIVGYDVVCRTAWGSGGHVDKSIPVHTIPNIRLLSHHESDVNMAAVMPVGCFGPPPAPYVGYDEPRNLEPSMRGKYWVFLTACNPSRKWMRKMWHGWRQLADKLDDTVVFLGARHDSKLWMGHVGYNFCGKISLRESLGWIKNAKGAIGIDCGLAHASAALGTPTTVLFGPTSDVKNRQIGPNVRILRTDIKCAPCQFTERWNNCESFNCMNHKADDIVRAALERAR